MLTPDQEIQMKSWSEQRDAILRDISTLQVKKDSDTTIVTNLGAEKSALMTDIGKIKGALELFDTAEEDRGILVRSDIATLLVTKSQVENDISVLGITLSTMLQRRDDLDRAFTVMMPIYERVMGQIEALNNTISRVVTINAGNSEEMNALIANLKEVLSAFNNQRQ